MKYKFEDIIYNITEKKKPSEEDRLNYIGLEHLDSGSLYITRWGAERTPEGEKIVMKKGDVLFGKRRAYQKKVAISPIDGVFSAHGMVLRPKEDVICKEFLPFFISSDYFLNEAIRISVGGLSPTINWKDIKVLEFNLPSLAEQKVLAEKLWAAYEVKQSYLKMIEATEEMVKSQFIEMFGDPISNPFQWNTKKMLEVGELKNGMNFSTKETGIEIKCLGVSDFKDNTKIDYFDTLSFLSLNTFPSEEYLLKNEDIVFVRSNGNKDLVGRCVIVYPKEQTITFSGFCIRLRLKDSYIQPLFLLQLLRQSSVRKQLSGRGANINNLNQRLLSSLELIVPPISMQDKYICICNQADKTISELRKSIDAIDKVIKSLINENL